MKQFQQVFPMAVCAALLLGLTLVMIGGCDGMTGSRTTNVNELGPSRPVAAPGAAPGIVIDSRFARFYDKVPPNTILLAELHGRDPGGFRQVEQELEQGGLKDAFVVADEDEGYLCYGLYEETDPKLNKKYAEDKQKLAMVRRQDGRRVFPILMAVPLPEPAPHSPYDISEAPAPYTVMVGTFDLYGRKQQAADYARRLREQGYEAYVYQGESMSHVTVGAFPIEIFEPLQPGRQSVRTLRSPEVKALIERFKYINWNGHQFTAEEAEKLKMGIRGVIPDGPQKGTEYHGQDTMANMVKVRVFRIPEIAWTKAGKPVPPASTTERTTVLPQGPILSQPPQR